MNGGDERPSSHDAVGTDDTPDVEEQSGGRVSEGEQRLVEMAAHEIRSSLGTVGMLVGTLVARWDELDEDGRLDIAIRLRDRFAHMQQVVGRFLDVEAAALGLPSVRPELVRITDHLRRIQEMLAPELARHELLAFVDEELQVHADPHGLERVLSNLLSNAARYSPAGSTITVRARRTDGEVEVVVADEGPGIPDDEQERIFEHFTRGSAAEPGVPGSGVGLSVAKAFVEAHGGRLWLESAPGEGSTFGFTLPRAGPPSPGDAPD